MVRNNKHIALLNVLRKKTFQSRDEFYRNAAKIYDEGAHGETVLYMAIRTLEQKGALSIDRVGEGKRSRMVSIRLTESGLFDLERGEMQAAVHNHRTDPPKRKEIVPADIPQPCGAVMTKCYMSGCYLAYKCSLK